MRNVRVVNEVVQIGSMHVCGYATQAVQSRIHHTSFGGDLLFCSAVGICLVLNNYRDGVRRIESFDLTGKLRMVLPKARRPVSKEGESAEKGMCVAREIGHRYVTPIMKKLKMVQRTAVLHRHTVATYAEVCLNETPEFLLIKRLCPGEP